MKHVKKYTVTIFGEAYTLVGDESEADVVKASYVVDTIMREILNKTPHTGSYHVAVLTALKLSLQLITLESVQENNKQAVKKLIDQIEHEKMIS
jgi:cell division protein ZapA (FtsZ GTPase activity inhibitor)